MTFAAPEPEPDPAPRPALLTQGLGGAVLCLLLAGAAALGSWPLAVAVLAVQVVVILGFLALVEAPGSTGAFVVAVGAAVAADVVVLASGGRVSGLAAVVGLSVVASLTHQLLRKGRQRVTESVADTLVVVVVGVAAGALVALRAGRGGGEAAVVALASGGAALLFGRVGDRLAPGPALAVGSVRGWPGLVLALGAGTAVSVLVSGNTGQIVGVRGALLGLVVSAAVAAGDLAVDLAAAELTAARRDVRRVEALMPVGLLLPVAALAPVAYVAGRLVMR